MLFLKAYQDNELDYNNCQTQYILWSNNSRPDIAIINNIYEILIEVKIADTALTENQPSSIVTPVPSKSPR